MKNREGTKALGYPVEWLIGRRAGMDCFFENKPFDSSSTHFVRSESLRVHQNEKAPPKWQGLEQLEGDRKFVFADESGHHRRDSQNDRLFSPGIAVTEAVILLPVYLNPDFFAHLILIESKGRRAAAQAGDQVFMSVKLDRTAIAEVFFVHSLTPRSRRCSVCCRR